MREVGAILHLANSGRLIVKLKQLVEPGAILVDEKGRSVVKVSEIIGPTLSPYASGVPLTARITRAEKGKLYLQEKR